MNKLVSIVSPCYNGESYIERYFESILSQTYRPLELVLVNDGSKDRTDEIVRGYEERLRQSGIIFKYIKKENCGVGAAVNAGLKYTTGDYLIWPDTDDVLMPDSIRKRVEFLENNPQFGFVYSDGETYDETNLSNPKSRIEVVIPDDGYLFKNIVSGNVEYNPCGYMLRMDAFLDVNSSKEIYPSGYGQNIQMLMPISYKYKCGYLQEVLYGRVDRRGSLSKKVWSENDAAWRNRVLGLSDIYTETLKTIGGFALAYIPYVKYRDLRILTAISKNVSKKEYRQYRGTLRHATYMLVKEIFKTCINLLFHKF